MSGIAVGDVSGKGAPAAIYAALVSGLARSMANEEPSAAGMLEAINLSLSERPIEGQYVSMIYAIWDDGQRLLQIANSGLPRPLHLHNGKLQEIQATGLPIGLFPTATYDELNLRGQAGDVFLFFSDGILDATSAEGEMFGRHRVEKIALANARGTAEELVDAIFTAVSSHAEGVEAFDDQTIVALKVKGPSAKK
jgi:sigma-B regulation protein RsbU (phosphoserine phosphatase)